MTKWLLTGWVGVGILYLIHTFLPQAQIYFS